ncbi:MAG: DUF6644 family protein [Halieaceae bacterium]
MAPPFPRTLMVLALIGLGYGLAVTELYLRLWIALLPVFEWMETTPVGAIGKTWGAAFAVIEAFHLLGLALLGGAVFMADGRLLGLCFTEIPQRWLEDQLHRLFMAGLWVLLITGVFMACAVAVKIYYLPVYWYKMLALATGIIFALYIRRPLLQQDVESMSPWLRRLVALSSLMIWFTVAATGRWIGFS